jgi:hypothetical protein
MPAISTWIDDCSTFDSGNWVNTGPSNVIAAGGKHVFPTLSTGATNGRIEGLAAWDLTTGAGKDYAVVGAIPSGQTFSFGWVNGLGTGVWFGISGGTLYTYKTIYNAASSVVGHGTRSDTDDRVLWLRYSSASGGSLHLESSTDTGAPTTLATILVSDLTGTDATFTPTAISRIVAGGNPDFGVPDADPNVTVEGYNVGWTDGAPADPTIVLTPTTRNFTAVVGGVLPNAQTVAITNSGGGTLTPALGTPTGPGAAYLTVSLLGGTVTIEPASIPATAGAYAYSIPITAVGATNTPQSITGTYTVTEPLPILATAPDEVTFFARAGDGTTDDAEVALVNEGTGTLNSVVESTTGAASTYLDPVIDGAMMTVNRLTIPGETEPTTLAAVITVGDTDPDVTPQEVAVSLVIRRRNTIQLDADILNQFGSVIRQGTFSSDDEAVATVTSDGLVTAVAAGECNIFKTDPITAEVSDPKPITVTPDS